MSALASPISPARAVKGHPQRDRQESRGSHVRCTRGFRPPFLRRRRWLSVLICIRKQGTSWVRGWPFRAVADAMEVIPRTLIQNSGGNVIRLLTELRVSFFFFPMISCNPNVILFLTVSTPIFFSFRSFRLSTRTAKLMGCERRHWKNRRHEGIWTVRVRQ